MITNYPPLPKTMSDLDLLIKNNQWSPAWDRGLLDLTEKHAELWLRLAEEIWEAALLDISEDEVPEDNLEKQKDGKEHCKYSSDTQIARILIGLGSPCKRTPTPSEQDDFGQITCTACTIPGERMSTRRDIRLIYLKIIKYGKDKNMWDLCLPSYPVLIKRPTPRIQLNNLKHLHQAREVRHTFINILKENSAYIENDRTSACLLSAILFGGIVEREVIEALTKSINEPLVHSASGLWIDLDLYPNNPVRNRTHRFWPDPITTSLWLTLNNGNESPENILKNLQTFLFKILNHQPPSLSILIKGVAQELSLELPEVLVHIATGQTITHPVKKERLCTIQNIEDYSISTQRDQISSLVNNKLEIHDTRAPEKIKDDPLLDLIAPPGMSELREAVRNKNIRKMKNSLNQLINHVSERPTIIDHLAKWLINLPTNPRASTRQWMFGLIGSRLVSLCENDDPSIYDDDEIENIYFNVIADANSASHRRGMRYALSSFHQYLMKGQTLAKPSILKELDNIEVSSRIITHEEYQQSLKLLGKPTPSNNDPLWLEACQIILILLFRLGLRRRELLLLPLHDIHGDKYIEILIRPHSERELKTANALRTLLLNGFLEDNELEIVRKWLKKRKNDENITNKSNYFFALVHSDIQLISETTIINRIVDVLRAVTNDNEIHIHHLRHSFASWYAISLIGYVAEENFESWAILPDTQKWLRKFPEIINNLYPNEAPQHNLIYLLSTLLGHATPAISMEHYIHGLDQILGNAIWRFFSIENKKIHPQCFDIDSLRTYQRWSKGGWPLIIDRLSKNNPKRCLINPKTNAKNPPSSNQDQLFNHYYQIWETLKTINDSNLSIDNENLSSRHKMEDIKKWFTNSNELHTKGFISKSYPTFPLGDMRKTRIMEYANKIQLLAEKDNGQDTLTTFLVLWKKYKIKGKGVVRFTNTNDALIYKECLLNIGVPWKQINFTWIGSRFNKNKEKFYKSEWRKELNIPKSIKILTNSINNDRPLDKTKGYMDIKIINNDDLEKSPLKSSTEFQWLIWIAMIEQQGNQ